MKARLITAFTIIIFIPMLIISLIITFRITGILNEGTDDKLSYTLFAMAKSISEDIEKIKSRIDTLKNDSNVINGVGFKDGSQFLGLLNSTKSELGLDEAVIYSWKEDMPAFDRSDFFVIDSNFKEEATEKSEKNNSDKKSAVEQNVDETGRVRKLVYIEEGIIKDEGEIIGVIRLQKNFDNEYLIDKVSNFKRLAGMKAALFNGKESLATSFGTSITLDNPPQTLENISLTVSDIAYQAKLAKISDTIVDNEAMSDIHLLVGLSKEEANATLNGIITLIVIVATISTVSAIFLGFLVARWLSEKMNSTVSVVERIAQGDLSVKVESQKKPLIFSKDEMAKVLDSVGVMSDELTKIVKESMKSVGVVVDVSKELNESNEQLSQRAEVQASSIEEISATLEQMTSTIKSTADNSKKVRDLVEDTNEKIRQGETIIAEAIQAMNLISESSNKIGNITNVVDDIAFQTNLLSLNASVEAARAGEQGKGFAVVANEVRNLAQLSTNAVNDIRKLIEDTSEKVERGSTLVNQSGDILEEIVEKMKKVAISMQEVADASSEQETGIHHVNDAVQQIDSMTQKNTILADRTMVLSNKMSSLSSELQNLMSFFKLENYTDYTSYHKYDSEEEISDEELFGGEETGPMEADNKEDEEILKPDKITNTNDDIEKDIEYESEEDEGAEYEEEEDEEIEIEEDEDEEIFTVEDEEKNKKRKTTYKHNDSSDEGISI